MKPCNRFTWLGGHLVVVITLFGFLCPAASWAQEASATLLSELSTNSKLLHPDTALQAFAKGAPEARYIIMLKKPAGAEDSANLARETAKANRRASTAKMRTRLFDGLERLAPDEVVNSFDYSYGFAANLTPKQLQELLENENVESVEEDVLIYPHLKQGIPLMNAAATRYNYGGEGVAIAICDTGIDYSHPKLGNGDFPNDKVIGGYDCGDDDEDPMDEYGHGTACAGIAAGDIGSTGNYIGGVAYNAKLYAVKISYQSFGSAYTSDMVEGWEWCITHQYDDEENPILIISTSFGGGQYDSVTDCDNASSAMTDAAANAKAAGITLFASSGNDGWCDSMAWPACLSDVVSVGAVYDADIGTYYPCLDEDSCATKYSTTGCSTGYYGIDDTSADMVTSYSNSASFLDLFAPSNKAYTTDIVGADGYGLGNYYSSFGGTSAASPYAAGAAALVQSAAMDVTGGFLDPDDLQELLEGAGESITDDKVAVTALRVDVGEAVDSLDDGIADYDISLTLYGPDDDAVAAGEFLGKFYSETTNNSDSDAVLYIYSYVVPADGSDWKQLGGEQIVPLDAGETRRDPSSGGFYLMTPDDAPTGTSYVGIYILDEDGDTLASDWYTFEVEAGSSAAAKSATAGKKTGSAGWQMQ